MQILEHGQEQGRTLLFFPCVAEPLWAFSNTIAQISQKWHVFQVVYDGHQPEYHGDFTSVEQTVDETAEYLKSHGISRLDGAYGCSMGAPGFLASSVEHFPGKSFRIHLFIKNLYAAALIFRDMLCIIGVKCIRWQRRWENQEVRKSIRAFTC